MAMVIARSKLFWDFDTAPLPNWDYSLLSNIDRALAASGLTDDLLKIGWGTNSPPKPTDALAKWASRNGVRGLDNKEDTFRKIVLNILCNHDDDVAPVNYVLFTSNIKFLRPLSMLRERGRGHNIVLARPSTASILDQVATIVWDWEDLVLGKLRLPPIADVPVNPGTMIGGRGKIPKYEMLMIGQEGGYPMVVWWDIDSTPPPPEIEPGSIVGNIEKALRTAGFLAPLKVHAYGDMNKLNCSVWDQFVRAGGATFTHLPSYGDRDASIDVIMTDMAISIRDNPPPVNYFLISNDYRFMNFIEELDNDDEYHVILARSSTVTSAPDLCDFLWHWEDLARGGPPQDEINFMRIILNL